MTQEQSNCRSLMQRVHATYGDLPEGERHAASLVVENPGELAVWSASELATRAGISNATVSRLFQRLGYRNYEEARRESRELRNQGSPLYQGPLNTIQNGGSGAEQRLANELRRIEIALAAISSDMRVDIASRLATARQVHVAGYRNSRFLAEYFHAALAQFRSGVSQLTLPGQTLAEGVAGLTVDDIVFFVGFRRRPAFFNRLVTAVHATGARIAILADRSIREAPALAHWTIICPVESARALDSYGASMLILRELALETITQLGPKGRAHLERLEDAHLQLQELE